MTVENLSLWNKLGKTDPSQTKPFKRGGGFTGTAIKPIYTEEKMTETFGPVGIGWGFSEPQFQLVPGEHKELLVYCWLTLWFVKDGVRSDGVPGVGGDKVISYIKANEQYNRPERWENDDEAFKKAFTDAVGNAMKHLGMSADVHMGLFDDSKYVQTRRQEEAEEERQAQSDAQRAKKPAAAAATVTPFDKPAGAPAKAAGPADRTVIDTMLTNMRATTTVVDLKRWFKSQLPYIEELPDEQRREIDSAAFAHQERLAPTNTLRAG